MKRTIYIALFGLIFCTAQAHAALTFTFQHDGNNGVIFSATGSGTFDNSGGNFPNPIIWVDDVGEAFSSNLNFASFNLANPLPFAPGITIDTVTPDWDPGIGGDDDMFWLLSALPASGTTYNVSGSSLVTGLSFSDLTIGTFSNPTHPNSIALGGFTLIISDTVVPEPTCLALLMLAAAGAGMRPTRRRLV